MLISTPAKTLIQIFNEVLKVHGNNVEISKYELVKVDLS